MIHENPGSLEARETKTFRHFDLELLCAGRYGDSDRSLALVIDPSSLPSNWAGLSFPIN